MPGKLVILGASGHAKVVAEIARQLRFEVVGFIDEINLNRRGESFCGSTVWGGLEELPGLFASGVRQAIVGFGDNSLRITSGAALESLGFELVSAIHPTAVISSDVIIGKGTVVAAGAIINPSTVVGRLVIINTAATVDHDCSVEDGVSIGPGAHLAGYVRVGRGAMIGIGATIIDHKCIGSNSIVGAGAVVVKDVAERVVVAGVPAKILRAISS